jgi:hypothetical protein
LRLSLLFRILNSVLRGPVPILLVFLKPVRFSYLPIFTCIWPILLEPVRCLRRSNWFFVRVVMTFEVVKVDVLIIEFFVLVLVRGSF